VSGVAPRKPARSGSATSRVKRATRMIRRRRLSFKRRRRAAWLVQQIDAGVVHILPVDDLIEHEWDDDCVCGPDFELRMADFEEDACDGHIYTHHALDGRS
jgi:hypothetical protein